MNEFKTILTRLKEILATGAKGKILDRDVAQALSIKPTTLASYKSRNNPPYKTILTYCHDNRLDVRKVLFDEFEPVISYPAPEEDSKVRVRYFRTLEAYEQYLNVITCH